MPAPSTNYAHEQAIVHLMVQYLEDRLAGRHRTRIVNVVPIDHCRLGVLAPWRDQPITNTTPAMSRTAPTNDDLPDDDADPEDMVIAVDADVPADGGALPPPSPTSTAARADYQRRPPQSIGCEIVLQPEGGRITIDISASFAIYTFQLPTLDEQLRSLGGSGGQIPPAGMSLAEVSERRDVVIRTVQIRIPLEQVGRQGDGGVVQEELAAVLAAAAAAPGTMPRFPRQVQVPSQMLSQESSFQGWINQVTTGLQPRILPLQGSIEVRSIPQPDGTVRVAVYLCNDTLRAIARGSIASEDGYAIFGDAQMQVQIIDGNLRPIEILPIPQDYQYDRSVWAVGHNTSVAMSDDHRIITTQSLARYSQPRLTTQSQPLARFADLASNPLDVLQTIDEAMTAYAEKWHIDALDGNPQNYTSDEWDACQQDQTLFLAEQVRFRQGMAALRTDPRLMSAFQAMNRVMGRIAQDSGFDCWRLFQIVFIVTQLPAMALRGGVTAGEWPTGTIHTWAEESEIADVLWFPTGGGKTEAYLGMICCAILYDRLRGKQGGLTAWIRFPLRMLSLQQLQRAMRMIWETELERQQLLGEAARNSDPIRLGYFAGSGATPNLIAQADIATFKDPMRLDALRIVPDCPACGGKKTIEVDVDEPGVAFTHTCRTCNAILPLAVSDSEVYRQLPALVVGTVDKMAIIGFQGAMAMLWAGPRWRCKDHGYALGEYCLVYGCKTRRAKGQVVQFEDPSPTFHIQDELHLLQEELGAFAGHYETLIRSCERSTSRSAPKIVAATATVEGFEHQTQHLYGVRESRRFPGRGYQRHETFYATLERDNSGQSHSSIKEARIFVAFRPASGNATDAASRCVQILHEAIHTFQDNPYLLMAQIPGLRNEDEVRDLLYYFTSTLTYVGSLQSGTRVKDSLNAASGDVYSGTRDLTVEYLSGRSSSGEVADVIHRMEEPPLWNDESHLDAVVATNMISHGVDIGRINLMVMDSFPATVPEYIQASSRSGRKKVGLVVVCLPAFSRRAASIYHRFKEFHAHLDRMVPPVAINRFAKYALDRTISGVLIGIILGRLAPNRTQTVEIEQMRRRDFILQFLQRNPGILLPMVQDAYGLGREVYDVDLEQAMGEALEDRLEQALTPLRTSQEKYVKDSFRPSPMTSLRDVEVGVPFVPTTSDPRVLGWFYRT